MAEQTALSEPNRITFEKKELQSGFTEEFPYVNVRVSLDRLPEKGAPWHWHEAVEIFYIESGNLEYRTPSRVLQFPEGTGGLVIPGTLHTTCEIDKVQETVQLLHIFDPSFIAGPGNGVIARKYIFPFVSRQDLEIIPVFPDCDANRSLLAELRNSFYLDQDKYGYEFRLREVLSGLWLKLTANVPENAGRENQIRTKRLQQMMLYVHEHYSARIGIAELASSIMISERECYRLFRECLHCTPVEYILSYRLQMAREMLIAGDAPVTEIALKCGFGSSSYFGKCFMDSYHCSPLQYRRRWQNNDKIQQN